jgi:hypothetical protein
VLSGCADKQTSADVSNTASFQLPADAGPGGAGGACTSSLLLATAKDAEDGNDDHTWVSLLDAMRETLKSKGYEQIPQLSSSRKLDLQHGKFSLLNPEAAAGSKKRAVLVGINYVGQRGELRGCHNDVVSMKRFIEKRGFSDMRVLMDDSSHEQPTGKNILAAIDWLTEGASKGDSLFLHYSGHGGYVKDDNGDEADGMDETIVPVDFQSAGQIIDDLLFKELVMPIPAGVQLTYVVVGWWWCWRCVRVIVWENEFAGRSLVAVRSGRRHSLVWLTNPAFGCATQLRDGLLPLGHRA